MLTESGLFVNAKARMHETTRKEMEAGKEPSRKQDKRFVVSTYDSYKTTAHRIMQLFCKEMNREVHMKDFFRFGEMGLIEPQLQVAKWFAKHIVSPTIRYICL